MRQSPTQHRTNTNRTSLQKLLILITASAILSACGTPGGDKKDTDRSSVIELPQEHTPTEFSRELPPSKFSQIFSQAEQSLFDFDWMSAESALAMLPQELPIASDRQYLAYLQARVLYTRGDQNTALDRLQSLTQSTAHPALRHKIMAFQRYVLSLSREYLTSAQLGDQLLHQTTHEVERRTLRRKIWRDLQRVPDQLLQQAMTSTSDPEWRGWLELASLGIKPGYNDQYRLALDQWRSSHPEHPASKELPGGMGYLSTDHDKPKRIALLLPLSGRLAPAAQAVRDGYLASYYGAVNTGSAPLDIDIIDVLEFKSTTDAYLSALANGAEFVVGPLSKAAVAELVQLPNRQVPVLALNRIDNTPPPGSTALVQLALAPEDEAIQIADRAFGDGARRVLIIRPAGSWGNKMENALKEQWQKLGGSIAATASYSSRENYSSSMSTALNIPASKQRARDVRSMLATQLETSARRRQDIDAVFLLSKSGAEARSLKPLLDYHYAADLPVYATSSIYRATPDPRDKDLNGILLLETPWLLGTNRETRGAITAGKTGSSSYTRLNALGADAFLLQSNFSALRAGEDLLIKGNTGLLSLNPQLQIHRELQGATFDGGVLVAQ